MERCHAKGKCELCDRTTGKLDAHHLEGRAGTLKWWYPNLILLCFNCHRRGVHNEASSVQAKFREKIIALRGIIELENLVHIKDTKFTTTDLEDFYGEYSEKHSRRT